MLVYGLSAIIALILIFSVVRAGSTRHAASPISWGPCDPSVVNDTSLSCGYFDVPLDYQDPSVGNARLAVVKINATGERRGTVFFNPGGPGESGIAILDQNVDLLLEVTGGVYDVVSWDPRGVGFLTTPGEVLCFDSLAEYTAFFNGTIELRGIEELGSFDNPGDVDALLAQAETMQQKYEEVGQRCLQSPSGKFLKYIGTAATVRDMVAMADALEGPDTPINYFGVSYGTLIGSWFVNMFPERIGRVIIDGVLDPVIFANYEISTHFLHYLVSADTIYKALITGCALAGPAGCAAASEGDGPLDVDAKIQALLKSAYDAAHVNPSAPLTSGQIRTDLFFDIYSPTNWSALMNEGYLAAVQIINSEAPGNGSLHERSSDLTSSRGFVKRVSNDSPSYSPPAIWCADNVDLQGTTMADVFRSIIAGTRNISHIFGAGWYTQFYLCSFWPVRSVERYQGPFDKTLANKIIIGSNTYDPITTLAGAQRLAGLLGDDAMLVRLNGFGHTAIVGEPSTCIRNIYSAYMTNGTVSTGV
ncbi:alpha/beta-hydrolase [Lentinus brumalis]|uniref:Alpha/beta-hydrolase n=1 Tax=Lentinus brumalis TaxID=2498619 RepID=A0A371CYC7_9APHY|nr:alpha/beta-hydrolase [Polyporus brumalis]